jgi:hypothetical protein
MSVSCQDLTHATAAKQHSLFDHLVGAGDVDANVDHRPRSNSAIFLLTVPASLGAVSRKANRRSLAESTRPSRPDCTAPTWCTCRCDCSNEYLWWQLLNTPLTAYDPLAHAWLIRRTEIKRLTP